MTNPLTEVLKIWRAAKDLAAMDVARELAREAFKAEERLISIRWDFEDCAGVPFIWLEFPAGVMAENDDDASLILLNDYFGSDLDTSGSFPGEELEAVGYDLLRWEGSSCDVVFTREEVLATNPQ